MGRRLIVAATMALAAVPAVVTAPMTAVAAEACTPSITMGQPFQDPGGFVVFPASFTLCENSKVTVKFRDRDDADGWANGAVTRPAGSGSTYAGVCDPDGTEHRWVAYATVKTPTGGTVLAQSAKAYVRSSAVSGDCAPYPPVGACTPSLSMSTPFQDSAGYVFFPTVYGACETSRILIKPRDRDVPSPPVLFTAGVSPYVVGAGTTGRRYAAICNPDSAAHRYAAYSTMKTPDGGTLILRTDDSYFTSTPVSTCGPFTPPSDF